MSFWPTVATAVVRHRFAVVGIWALGAAVLFPATRRLQDSLDVGSRVRGSESAAVEDELRERFDSPLGLWSALVVTDVPSPQLPAGRELLRSIVDSLGHAPGVTRIVSWLDRPDTLLIGARGQGAVLIVGLDPGNRPVDALMPGLRRASAQVRQENSSRFPDLALRWTGFIAFNHDFRRTGSSDIAHAEARALPVTLILLLWAFGTIAAALLPLFAGIAAIALTLGAAVTLTTYLHLSILLVNVVSMIGLGLGIDYALLIVSRFRQAVAEGRTSQEAAVIAAEHGGRTIALSGLAVAIGFAALLGTQLDELRSVAVGGLLVTIVSVLLGVTLLPAVLSWVGSHIEWGKLPLRRTALAGPRWVAWGNYVTLHPWRVLLVAGLPVLLLAAQALRISTEVESSDLLPAQMEATQGLRDLQAMGRSAVIGSLNLIVDLPANEPALSERSWSAVRKLGDWFVAQPGVGHVRSLPALVGAWNPIVVDMIPADALRTFVSADRRSVSLDILPREDADRHDLSALVQRVRTADPATLTGLPGTRVRVGGITAFQEDYGAAVRGRRLAIISLVIGGTLLALFVGFRSVLVSIKAVALNLLSVVAAIGVLVIVFQDGYGAKWFGVDGATGGIFSSVPLLVFCIVFGLSMDYEVFLIARVQEARHNGLDERAAIVEGLARTARIITSAAAIMIAVFAAFTLGQFVMVKMLGLALAVAVALDATLVRLAIGPALLQLAGDWNWWPGLRAPRRKER